jgi:ABC-type tungstate transport system substrate-binding protein
VRGRTRPFIHPSHPVSRSTVLANTWPLFLGMGILMLGSGLQGTLLGVRATLEGFPTVVTGLVMYGYYIG